MRRASPKNSRGRQNDCRSAEGLLHPRPPLTDSRFGAILDSSILIASRSFVLTMKAWRFYGFKDMRLDEVPAPTCLAGHVIAEILCVQPSVTEAQLAFGIPTLAYERIKRRLETEAPVQLFGHEFCARILETGPDVTRFRPGDRVAARAKLPCGECPFAVRGAAHLCRRGPSSDFNCPAVSRNTRLCRRSHWRGGRPHLRQRGGVPAVAQRQRGGGGDGRYPARATRWRSSARAAWAWSACRSRVSAARDASSRWTCARRRADVARTGSRPRHQCHA